LKYALAVLLAGFALAGCGGGNAPGNAPAPAATSRLAAFDAPALLEGLVLPDATGYWSMAEARNGNTFPVKAKVGQEDTIIARVMPGGKVAIYEDKQFTEVGVAGVLSRLQPLADKTWNAGAQASSCALILLAHVDSPWETLLELCLGCVETRVGNLWLGTHDKRGEAARLLALKIDTTQVPAEGYGLSDKAREGTVLLHWVQQTPLLRYPDGKIEKGSGPAGWGRAFATGIAAQKPRPRRVQLALARNASMRAFEKAMHEISGAALAEIEPYWPVLKVPEASEPPRELRKLPVFVDVHELGTRIEPPTMSEYWRASEQSDRLPMSGLPKPGKPALYLCIDAENLWSSRSQAEAAWIDHVSADEVKERLVANAGEFDPSAGHSDLQLLLAVDRRAEWQQVLALLSAMTQTGVRTLFVLVMDQLGPTQRLLDLSLPVAEPAGIEGAVSLSRSGIVDDGKYDASLVVGEERFSAQGQGFLSELSRAIVARKTTPDWLAIKLRHDEPTATFFQLLNALARLNMRQIRITP